MKNATIFLFMLYFHILDDFLIQGILASMKQKSWWTENPEYKELYSNDYLAALIIHSISWAISINIPVIIYLCDTEIKLSFWILLLANIIIHAFVDNLKANKKKINLVIDQSIHLVQIIVTYILIIFLGV